MSRRVSTITAARAGAILMLIAALSGSGVRADEGSKGSFEAETLAPGVTLLRPANPQAAWTNSLVVERTDGLLVVDAQPTAAAAQALLGAIGEISSQPVRYLVLSHPHAEASGGATAFPPSALIIASAGCGEALDDETYAFGAEMAALAVQPASWSAPTRPAPTLRISSPTRLADTRNEVMLLPMYQAHSVGDLMVELPDHSLLYMGATLFPDGNPYAGDASVTGWLNLLNHVIKRKPQTVVPLRGAAADLMAVRRQRDAFAWLRGMVEMAFIEQVPPAEMPAWVLNNDEVGARFDTQATPSFLTILSEKVVQEALMHRRKRGVD